MPNYFELPIGQGKDSVVGWTEYSANGYYEIRLVNVLTRRQTFVSETSGVLCGKLALSQWPRVKEIFGISNNNRILAIYILGSSRPFVGHYYRYEKNDSVSNPDYYSGLNESSVIEIDGISYYLGLSYNTTAYTESVQYNYTGMFSGLVEYATIEDFLSDSGILSAKYPIIYRPTNCSFPNAPNEALIGETVVIPVEFPDGYGLANTGDIYVQCNGVVIPSTYENGQLTFTMPDPS